MKVSSKLAYFKDVINRDAEEQSRLVTEQTDEKLRAAAESAAQDAKRRADKRVQAEIYKIGVEKNRRIAAAAVAAKKIAVETQNRLINKLFEGVAKTAGDFVRTEGYRDWLVTNVPERARPYPNARIIVMERDKDIISELYADDPDKPAFEFSGEDFIGGFKVFLPERSAVLDCTFRSRLSAEKKDI